MDGGIVADFITSGLLTLQNAGVTLRALDTDDTEVVKVDQTGLYAIKGTIAGFTIKDDIYDQGFIRNDGDVYCKYGCTVRNIYRRLFRYGRGSARNCTY